ncbi:peptidase M15 [Rhodopseudomonas palustris]|uniref:Peptidase M15 n=1 Tax=Rhodopseudomonas palustris TaxID=1076 RepID=A0A323UGI7_RHOPL|nr:D-alanyl-D-alanine carboxypeptidase family protein [Rhodopseudomonas palustris]PZA11654.1 peptidase M15 [Rhodopseudomonas palustris]
MPFITAQPCRSSSFLTIVVAALLSLTVLPRIANAEALLLVEADTGKVLQAENATYPWHPASVTKLMTLYVTLQAVKQGRLTADTLLTVSPIAASQSPSKMGFRPGTQLTVDNALKMMMVKSANDMAVVLAEGVGGSIDGFSEMMNDTAARLGMTQTHYVNPNGLPADEQVTSARDLAILARAIIRDLPEYEYYVHIPAIRFGKRVTRNFNKLIGRYPGADGFKTGFICASGYNLVASATRNGRRLIAVVLGANSGTDRAVKAAQLLERGFSTNTLAWLTPSLGTVDNLAPIAAAPPDLRDEMCGPKRKRPASDEDETVANALSGNPVMSMFQPPALRPADMIAAEPEPTQPVVVYTGPTRTGAALIAAESSDSEHHVAKPAKKKGRKAAKKKETAEEASAENSAAAKKPKSRTSVIVDTNKPAAAKHGAKPHTAADKPAASKPKPKAAKPASKSATSETKPKS